MVCSRYKEASQKEKEPYYNLNHFFIRHTEMQTKHFGKENSLCPIHDKYGTQIWENLRLCVDLVYGKINFKREKSKDEVYEFEAYFMRGGGFYASLESKNKCIHWCTVFALSDPVDKYFYKECDHKHTETDFMVEKCNTFFQHLLEDA